MFTNKLAVTLATVLLLGAGAVQAQSNSPFPPRAAESSEVPKLTIQARGPDASQYATKEPMNQVRSGNLADRPHVLFRDGPFPPQSEND